MKHGRNKHPILPPRQHPLSPFLILAQTQRLERVKVRMFRIDDALVPCALWERTGGRLEWCEGVGWGWGAEVAVTEGTHDVPGLVAGGEEGVEVDLVDGGEGKLG